MKHPNSYDSTPAIRKRMANVKLKGGKLEKQLALALWHKGVRYRLNYKKLPGSPDIAITKYRIAVFVDGEFWHGYDWSNKKEHIKHNQSYWMEKIEENIARDKRDNDKLFKLDWYVIRFWSKAVKDDLDKCVNNVLDAIEMRK